MRLLIAKHLLRTAIKNHSSEIYPVNFDAYEWESFTAYRVLLRTEDGCETDVILDKLTGCERVWVDGLELGSPELN